MARQAGAERERRARVIHAEGGLRASQQPAAAAQVIGSQPAAFRLRCLETLTEVAAEKNSTIVSPLPLELLQGLLTLPVARSSADATPGSGGQYAPETCQM